MKLYAGVDAGSVSVKLVLLDAGGRCIEHHYTRHKGRPSQTALRLLEQAVERYGPVPVAVTGTAGGALARELAAPHVNELVALALALRQTNPEVRTVMEMGGEDAKFLLLEDGTVKDFALNSVCAAGTGSFLDQQAERMRLGIEEFAALALKSASPPRIAGRCSVFAKSDMIHLQQIATPVADIVAGLCFAVARNFEGSIVRNRPMPGRVAFLGGVALNRGVVRAFREVFGIEDLLTPEPPTIYSAMGAALELMQGARTRKYPEVDGRALQSATRDLAMTRSHEGAAASSHGVLAAPGDGFDERHDLLQCAAQNAPEGGTTGGEHLPAYMGVDIGSISTCLAVVDESGALVAKRYLRTASRPIEAVRQGLREIREELGEGQDIRGVGATGSGRYMIADCIGADLVKNEITAQARGAVSLDALEGGAGVDTVFEIGGQDSKYISLQDGVILDFEMNKACAAGTGSFLEEQAEKLGVSVKGEFAGLALEAEAPCGLGERCTVFMENSLMSALQQGAGKDDLLAGLSYSIVENYINRVVAGRPIGERIFFQGGTACNKAVVAAFEKFLGKEIRVPRHTDVSGAIGMALLAREHMLEQVAGTSAFKGFEKAQRPYEQSSFECKGCDNRCEINRVRFEGDERSLYYGGRCEKYDIRRTQKNTLPDLFALRQQELERAHKEHAEVFAGRGRRARLGRMGLPRVFFMQEWLPFFSTLLWELGFEVVVSPPTDHHTTSLGAKTTLAETCFPLKAALGHVRRLLQDGVERIFLPSFVDMGAPAGKGSDAQASLPCPLTQSFPYQARALLRDAAPQGRVFAPVLHLPEGRRGLFTSLLRTLALCGVRPRRLWQAIIKAEAEQQRFQQTLRSAGRELLEKLGSGQDAGQGDKKLPERALVIIGRGYNALDAGMNLDMPRKLASLDTVAIPMDALPLDGEFERGVLADWPEMYWRSGQRMLATARAVRQDPRLDALVIGSFSCGPDSFILPYFTREMRGKPFLHIEIDEHSADAGVVTRCEAFLDSLEMRRRLQTEPAPEQEAQPGHGPLRHKAGNGRGKGRVRKVYIPRMGDHAFGLAAAFEACGVDAEVMPSTDRQAMELARRHVSGKECYPFAVTTGDMLKTAFSPGFKPESSAFFMPSGSGPCRFGQYNLLQRMILERAGFPETPILAPIQDSAFYEEMGEIGGDFARISWKGILVFDLLAKCLQASRPYERSKGQADALYGEALQELPRHLAGDEAALGRVLAGFADDFGDIRRQGGNGARPLVGIVGEIFVRTNIFSNEDLVRKVETLGGEAWLASVDEWVYYVNWGAARNALKRRKLLQMGQVLLKDAVQRRLARRLEHAVGSLRRQTPAFHDPGTRAILKKAAPHLHHSFRGEAVLSVGKAVDMLEHGAKGIIVAMPFGCMPGTVATSLLRSVCDEYGAPMISIPYDGTASSATRLQLEAFMEQVLRRA